MSKRDRARYALETLELIEELVEDRMPLEDVAEANDSIVLERQRRVALVVSLYCAEQIEDKLQTVADSLPS